MLPSSLLQSVRLGWAILRHVYQTKFSATSAHNDSSVDNDILKSIEVTPSCFVGSPIPTPPSTVAASGAVGSPASSCSGVVVTPISSNSGTPHYTVTPTPTPADQQPVLLSLATTKVTDYTD